MSDGPVQVHIKTHRNSELAVGRYPTFSYNSEGGGGPGAATLSSARSIWDVTFEPKTLKIPDLCFRTGKLFGIPLPPGVNIRIDPIRFQGTIDKESGKIDLDFAAEFFASLAGLYKAPPLTVQACMTTESSQKGKFSGSGKRMNEHGRARMIAIATVPKTDSLFSILLAVNICFFYAGVKKLRQARFATAVRLLTELDEDGLKFCVKFLPAWVKFSDYERAKFLNDAAQMLWPAFDKALCSLIKSELEPYMRQQSPSMIGGLSFERLSFGHLPISILGVRHVPSWNADNLGIDLDLDVRWAGQPDTLLRLMPSRRWMSNAVKIGKLRVLPAVDMTPVMNAQLHTVQIACVLRVSLAPVLDDLPFIGGVGLSILDQPYLDFDLRLVNGPDLLSIPALASWLRASLMDVFVGQMLWPKRVIIPILQQHDEDSWINAPMGILKLKVLQADLPARVSRIGRKDRPLNPYVVLAVGPEGAAASSDANRWEVCTETRAGTTMPHWHEVFVMVVQDPSHHLRVIAVHDAQKGDYGSDTVLGRVDIPLGSLVREHGRQGDKFAEVTRAALQLQQATTQAISQDVATARNITGDSNEGGGSIYASPAHSMLPSALPFSSSEEDATSTAGQSKGLATLLEDSTATSPHILSLTQSPRPSGTGLSHTEAWAAAPIPAVHASQSSDQSASISEQSQPADSQIRQETSKQQQQDAQAGSGEQQSSGAKQQWKNTEARPLHKHATPRHTMQHRTAHEAALACAEDEGAWLPLLPIKTFFGKDSAVWATEEDSEIDEIEPNARGDTFFPTLPILGSLMGGAASAATGIGSLFSSRAPSQTEELEAKPSVAAPPVSVAAQPSAPLEKEDQPSSRSLQSFFDWHHHATRKALPASTAGAGPDANAQPSSPVHKLVQQLSLEAESDSDESGSVSEADSTSQSTGGKRAQGRPPSKPRRAFARLFHPLSRTAQAADFQHTGATPVPDSERADPPAESNTAAQTAADRPAPDGQSAPSPFASSAPAKQPPALGAFIVLVQTANLTEARLDAPAARLRLGNVSQQSPVSSNAALGCPVARAEWNFRACFAVELPCPHEHLLVEVGNPVRETRMQAWGAWVRGEDRDRGSMAGDGGEAMRDMLPWGTARVRIGEVLRQGQCEGAWKLWRTHIGTGAPEHCGQVALRLAWLPCI
ncbi:hypothetical protein WJX73_010111 [Symbiochloris irregularis]|uniref:C2 domain-containing protein n=1 Tax=Symbiochloris irregularis TaxID=706552 RepID=A0AAW1PFE5_9CHLO